MTKTDLIPGKDYYHIPAILETTSPLSVYTFVDFNKIGNCIWKLKGTNFEDQFTVTLSYTLGQFKTI